WRNPALRWSEALDWDALVLSVELASATTLLLCLGGLPLAYWLAATRWGGKFLVEAVVALPLVLPPTVLGFYLLLALGPRHTLGEFGVVLMVGGNIPRVTRTVSIAIFDDVQALDYAAAAQTSLFLLLISFSALAATYAFQRRAWLL